MKLYELHHTAHSLNWYKNYVNWQRKIKEQHYTAIAMLRLEYTWTFTLRCNLEEIPSQHRSRDDRACEWSIHRATLNDRTILFVDLPWNCWLSVLTLCSKERPFVNKWSHEISRFIYHGSRPTWKLSLRTFPSWIIYIDIQEQQLDTFITLHYITLHYITLHYITLHYITLHYITLHYITLHYITLHYITLHYITLHYITLHYITLHYIILHYI